MEIGEAHPVERLERRMCKKEDERIAFVENDALRQDHPQAQGDGREQDADEMD